MALFSDNDRGKVDEDIDIDKVDEEVDEDQVDDETDQDDEDAGHKQDKKEEKPVDKKPEVKPEETVEHWKNKFAESTREAQVLAEREKEAQKKIEELTKPKEITDESMKAIYPDWDNFDDSVKGALKGQVKLEQEVTELKRGQSEYLNERKWAGQIDAFLAENDETEKIAIKDKEAFKKYCNKPERKGMNLGVLAAAFAYEVGGSTKTEPKKGSMLESGSGQGATNKHTTDKKEYTAEDAKRLRENSPREYQRLVKAGKLDIKI